MSAFEGLLVPEDLREAVSGDAWLAAMLEVEWALARAGAAAGIVPEAAVDAIADACNAGEISWEELFEEGRAAGNPVEPLVRALRAHVGSEHERYVHLGATSQDVVDTAAMIVGRHALAYVVGYSEAVAEACADIAREHRSTPMVARTLLQHAVPTTFGLVAAGWLSGMLDARARLVELSEHGFVTQLGGAAGTLAAFGADGLRIAELFAGELHLKAPTIPWHTNRVRIADLGAAIATAAGVCGKVALDVVLLAQSEVGEVREAAAGGSSTMPQKRNPIRATLARANAQLAAANASVLQASLVQEHQRAAGAWHAEWEALSGVLAYGGGAVASIGEALEGLEVHAERMRANLESSGGLVLSERVALRLAGPIGRSLAHDIVAEASASELPFRDALLADSRLPLSDGEIDALLDPTTYLGSAEALVDRTLERYDHEVGV